MPCFSRRSKKPLMVVQSSESPYSASARRVSSAAKPIAGAGELPSPSETVVMPCRIVLSARPLTSSGMPAWPCISMKPGDTTRPAASISRAPRSLIRPTDAMRPPAIATSAYRQGLPVPSTTLPLRMTRSNGVGVGCTAAGSTCARQMPATSAAPTIQPRVTARLPGTTTASPVLLPSCRGG